MASFGFSIGDIILISNYAYSVYKSCQNAGDNFREITSDVASLRTLLLALDDECKNPQSSFQQLPFAQRGELAARLQDCKADLRSVKKLLHDFRSLNTRDARYRDKLAFTAGKQAAIREKIATHSVRLQQLLNGINVGTFSRIERNTEAHYLSLLDIRAKLDRIHLDVLAGRRDATAFMNSEDAVALEDEVLDDHMTEVDVDVSYEVLEWIDKIQKGTLLTTKEYDPACDPSLDDAKIDPDASGSDSAVVLGNHEAVDCVTQVDEAPDGVFQYLSHNVGQQSSSSKSLPQLYRSYGNDMVSPATPQAPRIPKVSTRSYYAEVALTIDDDEQTIIVPFLDKWPWGRTVTEELHFDTKKEEWVARKITKNKPVRPSFPKFCIDTVYNIEFTLEEICTGASKRIVVRRRIKTSGRSSVKSSREFEITLHCKKGGQFDIIRYSKAGNLCETYTENIIFAFKRKPHAVFGGIYASLTSKIRLSTVEANRGWRREICHPSGRMIQLYADGPTNAEHCLYMRYGLPYAACPDSWGKLTFTVAVATDDSSQSDGTEECTTVQLVDRKRIGGPFFAQIEGVKGRVYESIAPRNNNDFVEILKDKRKEQVPVGAT